MTTTCRLNGIAAVAAAIFATLMPAASHAATTYYAKSSNTSGSVNGSLTNYVQWCTDEARTVLADPQPVVTANDDNTYVYTSIAGTKITQSTTFPEGTYVCFGTDGDEVGTSATIFSPNCNSVDISIPNCTIYGLRWCPNYRNEGKFTGNYRLVKTANKIRFGGSNLKDGVTYGQELGGTFTGERDVMITVVADSLSTPQDVGNCIVQVKFIGNFSGYKGKFETVAFTDDRITTGHVLAWFTSATSLGDPTAKCDDAVTLRHRGWLRIDEAVTQSATRGITLDLEEGQYAALAVGTGRWTLRTPVHGATGTLKKIGVGTVVLASALEPTNILVESGTLVISNGVSFAEGTTLTVANGATLQNRMHGIPNLTVVTEEGGTYVCPLDAVPYDRETATAMPIDCTSFTAEDHAILTKPIPIALSSSIKIPFSTTNRIAVATFSAAAGFTGDDFIDVSPKQYRYLPVTWFETVTEGDVTTLYLVARPAIQQTGDNNLTLADKWSDGKAQHAGADYFSYKVSGKMRTSGGSEYGSCNLNGETFTFDNVIWDYVRDFYARKLWLYGGSGVRSYHASNTSSHRIYRGEYYIDPNATLSNPATMLATDQATNTDFRVKLTGSGTLKIYTMAKYHADTTYGVRPFLMKSDGSAFTGRLYFTTDASNSYFDMYATNGLAFGGPIDTYTADAVRIAPSNTSTAVATASITASSDMTVNAENRGWYITTAALGASNNVTFTFSPPTLTLTKKLRKTGGGTLAMGCATIGAGTVFNVEEGFVKPLSATCCTNLDLTVASGAGLKVDAAPADEEVAAKGLIAKSIQPAEAGGEIAVVIDMPDELRGTDEIAVPVCTVPADAPDIAGALKVKAPVGYSCTLVADGETFADDGLVTYKAILYRMGMRVIVW